MRELKFRAWHRLKRVMFSPETMGADQLTLMPDGTGFVNVSGHDVRESRFISSMIPMQYTGLKDKNGKEVYEGDVWKRDTFTGLVTFEFCAWHVKMLPTSGCYQYPAFYSNIETGEVIGNIYENPELASKDARAEVSGGAAENFVQQGQPEKTADTVVVDQ